jgi:hypothetical protein
MLLASCHGMCRQFEHWFTNPLANRTPRQELALRVNTNMDCCAAITS